MPEISRLLGIVIAVYYRDHPSAHFHAYYGGFEVTVEVISGIVRGEFPNRALAHVQEWRQLHAADLLALCELALERKPLHRIAPLE